MFACFFSFFSLSFFSAERRRRAEARATLYTKSRALGGSLVFSADLDLQNRGSRSEFVHAGRLTASLNSSQYTHSPSLRKQT